MPPFQGSLSLPSGVKMGPAQSALIFETTVAAHAGTYTCTATNSINQVAHTASLFIQGEQVSGLCVLCMCISVQIPPIEISYADHPIIKIIGIPPTLQI